MKKGISIFSALIFAMIVLTGCGSRLELPENPLVFEQGTNGKYFYLTEGGRVYVPYCPYVTDMLGNCIGYCNYEAADYGNGEQDDPFRTYICELQGYSSQEWIVEILDTGYTREGMIFRELNATEIPEGLGSEYEWNQ